MTTPPEQKPEQKDVAIQPMSGLVKAGLLLLVGCCLCASLIGSLF